MGEYPPKFVIIDKTLDEIIFESSVIVILLILKNIVKLSYNKSIYYIIKRIRTYRVLMQFRPQYKNC